ncbi:4-hydroxy-tetrahydrodipicolinate synthase [Hartmannibacter diazotrophicus]|uniref:4-hydroxy-tetrahydrodipicolinate synthase n=1 Tax=Hartmannibacter diazotrophicus TaxID=1482074 RepID=A0A2C9DBD1_9HYPH|nr:dihydrodipicolinate synthase family protein [Hartmannibacter diazotrophicus]SON57479.1 4-hydroxy-tetrahydrodipicolinate synthase [Hartmannibacter diazotrophicus]
MTATSLNGVWCAATTAVNADLSPDLPAFVDHARTLHEEGCGIALLGTTGEANSFSIGERRQILEAALAGGLPADRLMPGTGLNAIPDTVELTKHALSVGVTKVVMLPPSYYKGVSVEGLYAAYSAIIDRIADDRLKVVLYHIPQVSGIPIPADLIEKLVARYPQTVVGIKDSAGDIANMEMLLERFPGFAVFPGADPLMLPLLKKGGAGCITATSNIVGADLVTVFQSHADPDRADLVDKAQARVVAMRTISNSYVQIPSIKAMVAIKTGNAGWRRTRPPLVSITEDEAAMLASAMARLDMEPAS